jgi:RimJ/RimL family protein N-acetyltransferase
MEVKAVVLYGRTIALKPLSEDYVPALARIGRDGEIWEYLPYGPLTSESKLLEHVRWLLHRAELGIDLPFVVIDLTSQEPIGCTRYLDLSRNHKRVEIGGTWYGTAYQGTAVNTEAKYLLLQHAFETLGCIRVQFKTDRRNIRSQNALEKIGAVKEGVLRSHMILPSGKLRDSVYYSIIEPEWPAVKSILLERLVQKY